MTDTDEKAQPERTVGTSPEVEVASHPVATPAAPRRSGFGGLVLGGVVAAALGAGATIYALPLMPQALSQRLLPATQDPEAEALRSELAALKAQVSELVSAPKDNAGADALAKAEAAGQAADAAAQTSAALDERLTALEKRPAADGGVSQEALAAFQRELDALKAQSGQAAAVDTSQIEEAAKAAEARIKAAQEETSRLAAEAEATAKAAKAQATVAHLQAALNSGAPITQPLSDLSALGIAIPEALSGQGEGVPTLADLRSDFPDAARAALRASLPETAGTGALERIGAFLQVQTGARSIEPREGTDPDAVLSRAEAQLSGGAVKEALAELAALPEPGRAAMADWISRAERRLAATEAVALLAQP